MTSADSFFDGPFWGYAAGLAGSAVICGSAYCQLGAGNR